MCELLLLRAASEMREAKEVAWPMARAREQPGLDVWPIALEADAGSLAPEAEVCQRETQRFAACSAERLLFAHTRPRALSGRSRIAAAPSAM